MPVGLTVTRPPVARVQVRTAPAWTVPNASVPLTEEDAVRPETAGPWWLTPGVMLAATLPGPELP